MQKQEWKEYSASGKLNTPDLKEKGYLIVYEGKNTEKAANTLFPEEQDLFMLIIDPLRIQHPIKKEKTEYGEELHILGSISIDAVIDRILIKRNKKGNFSIGIKHFD